MIELRKGTFNICGIEANQESANPICLNSFGDSTSFKKNPWLANIFWRQTDNACLGFFQLFSNFAEPH